MSKIKQITIFGGSGFIGRHVVRRLAKTGATIRIPTRDPEKALLLKPMGDVGQIVPFHCSTRSDAMVNDAIGNSDTVINLLGILYEKSRDSFQCVHVETAARIARLAKEQGAKRLIHMSALGSGASSAARYAQSKFAGEQAVRTFFAASTIFRPSIVFGPEDNFFNMFASLARFSPVLPLIGGGTTKFQPIYVGDVAQAVVQALTLPQASGATYELGGPQIYTFRELLELMLAETGRKRCLMNVPWGIAKLNAAFLELMPKPLLTRDQVELLKSDNIVSAGAKTLRDLDLIPTSLELILPTYLARYRGGDAVAKAKA
jgi:NADH dehydrogenase